MMAQNRYREKFEPTEIVLEVVHALDRVARVNALEPPLERGRLARVQRGLGLGRRPRRALGQFHGLARVQRGGGQLERGGRQARKGQRGRALALVDLAARLAPEEGATAL